MRQKKRKLVLEARWFSDSVKQDVLEDVAEIVFDECGADCPVANAVLRFFARHLRSDAKVLQA